MPAKILAALLLIFGGGITLYVLYKAGLALLQPVVQKKMAQQMRREKYEELENDLQLHKQADQNHVQNVQKTIKK